MRTNICVYFASNGGYCVYYPSNIFCNTLLIIIVLKIMGHILGYSPVLAGNIRSCVVLRPHVPEQKYLMDYMYNYFYPNKKQNFR